jgi:Xaa-Pro aminopeptidase
MSAIGGFILLISGILFLTVLVRGQRAARSEAGAYRFAVPVEAKGVVTLTVDERHPLETNYAVSQLNDQQIAVFVHDSRENVRLSQALGPIQAKKAVIASIADELAHRQAEINKIAQDQQRLRENMSALKGGSGERQLLARYLAQLSQQEDRIAVLRRESADLEQRLAQSQAELAALIQALALDVEVLDAAEADGPDTPLAHGEPPKRQ